MLINTDSCIIARGFVSGNDARFGLHPRATLTSNLSIVLTIARYPMHYYYTILYNCFKVHISSNNAIWFGKPMSIRYNARRTELRQKLQWGQEGDSLKCFVLHWLCLDVFICCILIQGQKWEVSNESGGKATSAHATSWYSSEGVWDSHWGSYLKLLIE